MVSSFLMMIVVESELFAEDTYRHAPFPLSFSCNYSKLAILMQHF